MNHQVTTAIAYVNAEPHLGFAFELVLADALARHLNAKLQTGTDENSLKNVRAARRRGLTTQALVDENAALFRGLAERLGLRIDDFVRTSSLRHRERVEWLWRACAKDLYAGRYRGRYCVGCEGFVGDRDLTDGRCPEHGTVPETVDEKNVFFALTRYVDQIREAIVSGRLKILPERAEREVLRDLEDAVDISVSRSTERAGGWGIPVPDDPDQTIYVWFDALANYLTGQGVDRWRSAGQTHVIGKGIVRFHGVYWPAFLLSAGLPLPDRIWVHGYLTVEGRKISKSAGNGVSPDALIDRFGRDALRYYLLRHVDSFNDGDVSEAHLASVYRADLADGLGNLVQRTVALAARAGIANGRPGIGDGLQVRVDGAVGRLAFSEALTHVWQVVAETDRYLQREAPWKLLRENGPRARVVLETALGALASISRSLSPFLPDTAAEIGRRIAPPNAGPPLFPKVTVLPD